MKKLPQNTSFLIIAILLSVSLYSQKPDTLWTKTYGAIGFEEAYSVLQTSDGGYIVTGLTGSYGVGGTDIWLIKTDASGDIIWIKKLIPSEKLMYLRSSPLTKQSVSNQIGED